MRREPCEYCPAVKLDDAIAANPVLQRAFDIDFLLSAGCHMTADDIDVEECRALRILKSERDKYQAEQIKKPSK